MISTMFLLNVQSYPHWSPVCLEFTCSLPILNLFHALLLCLHRSLTFWSVTITNGMMDLWKFRAESLVLPQVGKTIFSKSNHHDFLQQSCTWAGPRAECYKRKQWNGACLAAGTRQFCHDPLCYLPKTSFCSMFSFLFITRSYCLNLPLWRDSSPSAGKTMRSLKMGCSEKLSKFTEMLFHFCPLPNDLLYIID